MRSAAFTPLQRAKRKPAGHFQRPLHEPRLHRDNCLLQVQHRIVLASSWFRCAIVRSWKLPMNQPLSRPAATLSPPCGERAGRGETRRGSWPQLTSNFLEVFPLHELRSSRRKEAHFSNAEWGVRNAQLRAGVRERIRTLPGFDSPGIST